MYSSSGLKRIYEMCAHNILVNVFVFGDTLKDGAHTFRVMRQMYCVRSLCTYNACKRVNLKKKKIKINVKKILLYYYNIASVVTISACI